MDKKIIDPLMQVIGVTAPSGAGKSSLCNYLLKEVPYPHVGFGISATNRKKRDGEIHGSNYWFHPLETIQQMIANDEFLEHEEVYPGKFYGTPVSEIERICGNGNHVLLDIDVQGAISIKERIPTAKIIFIKPPSIGELFRRLGKRGDTNQDDIAIRIQKASAEIAIAEQMLGRGVFDASILNRDFEIAKQTILSLVCCYLGLNESLQV